MTIKTAFAAIALAVLPAFGYAACSTSHQAMSCADGTVWDAATQSCVQQVSS